MDTDIIRRAPPVEGKKPRRHDPRVCTKPECITRLASYNPGPTCYIHTPIRYPRTRGRNRR